MEQSDKKVAKIDLLELLGNMKPVLKRFWPIGLVLLLALTSIFVVNEVKTYRPVYEASASFTVKVVNPLYASANGYNAETAAQMEKTFPYILSSNALREYVKKHLGITTLPSVTAEVITGTNVFTLRVRDGDPQKAYDVLNAVITCYPELAEFVLGPTVMVLLDESGIPTQPVNSYSIPGAVTKGVLLAALLCFVAAVLIAMTNNTVHNEEELKQLLNCSCLGTLPATKVVGRNAFCPMMTHDHGKYGFSDAMHLIYLHLEMELKKSEHRVILVSSTIPGEGKTTVASNLAITMAQKGNRVLLIDCDLRNPSVAKAFGIANKMGLSEFLDGKIDANDVLKATEIPELFLITGGRSEKSDPAEQLHNEQFARLMTALQKLFDYIILDTSPCGLLADASEVAEVADCAIMVVRQDHASQSQVLDGARFLTDSKLPLIGSVLNGVKHKGQDGYGYGYSYGYGRRK